jgi:hypothetical protein
MECAVAAGTAANENRRIRVVASMHCSFSCEQTESYTKKKKKNQKKKKPTTKPKKIQQKQETKETNKI